MNNDAIDSIVAELDEVTGRARRLVDTTEPRLFTVRPDLTRWSASECIAHLSISTSEFLPVLEKALADARKSGLKATKPPAMDWIGAALRWFLEPPIRSRVKTTARFVPRAVRAKAESIGEFTALQAKLIGMIREAGELDLRRIKVVSPFDKRVRYNAFSAFRIIAAHQRRHLWQAEKAVAALRAA